MTKKNNFDDDSLIDQPDMGGYYYGNMFRFPEEELMRPQPPMQKNTYPKSPTMTPEYMPSDMSDEMPMQTPAPMQQPMTPSGPPMMDEEGNMFASPTLTNIGYTQAFLRTLIGKRVRVSFLIGTNLLVDRVGTLLEVGISYIVMRQLDANINVMGDLYSIKFVDIYDSPVPQQL